MDFTKRTITLRGARSAPLSGPSSCRRRPASGSPRPLTPETPARLSAWAILKRKAIGLSMRCFKTWSSLSYRLMSPRTKRLHGIDHVTQPCLDLAVAEEFHVGLMGARVMARFDAARLRRFGRPDAEISQAVHLSLVFSGGPRLDLFQSDVGQPPPSSGHTHLAFFIAPGTMLGWKKRLNDAGVPTYRPVQLGPPGEASLHFNDPSGNHLELVTFGFGHAIPVSPPDMSALGYTWHGRNYAPPLSTRAARRLARPDCLRGQSVGSFSLASRALKRGSP